MSQVVSLRGAAIPGIKHKADPDIVAKLRELLKRARDGQIQGFVYGLVEESGIGTGWLGKADAHAMIAAAAILNSRLLRAEE